MGLCDEEKKKGEEGVDDLHIHASTLESLRRPIIFYLLLFLVFLFFCSPCCIFDPMRVLGELVLTYLHSPARRGYGAYLLSLSFVKNIFSSSSSSSSFFFSLRV